MTGGDIFMIMEIAYILALACLFVAFNEVIKKYQEITAL